MQSYSNPSSRNTIRAAGGAAGNGGTLPGKVSVPVPGTDKTQKPYNGGGSAKAPAGFKGGIIPGKI